LVKEGELKPDEMLLAKSWDRYTAFQLAAEKNRVEILKNFWSGLKKSNSIQLS